MYYNLKQEMLSSYSPVSSDTRDPFLFREQNILTLFHFPLPPQAMLSSYCLKSALSPQQLPRWREQDLSQPSNEQTLVVTINCNEDISVKKPTVSVSVMVQRARSLMLANLLSYVYMKLDDKAVAKSHSTFTVFL